MTRRPWRVEYEDAEGITRIATTATTKARAEALANELEEDNPGVHYEVAENVHFEAHKEDV